MWSSIIYKIHSLTSALGISIQAYRAKKNASILRDLTCNLEQQLMNTNTAGSIVKPHNKASYWSIPLASLQQLTTGGKSWPDLPQFRSKAWKKEELLVIRRKLHQWKGGNWGNIQNKINHSESNGAPWYSTEYIVVKWLGNGIVYKATTFNF